MTTSTDTVHQQPVKEPVGRLRLLLRQADVYGRPTAFDAVDEQGSLFGTVTQEVRTIGDVRYNASVLAAARPQWRAYGHRAPEQALHALEEHLHRTDRFARRNIV